MRRFAAFAVSAIFMVLGGNYASAQGKYGADSAECIKYLSYYKEYYKQKSYDQALPSWRKAFSICPSKTRETVYTEGASLYRYLINKNRNNVIAKESYIDTLLMLHDMRAENYPKSKEVMKNTPEYQYRFR